MNRFQHLLLLALMGLITACSYNELPEDLVPQTIYEEDGLVLSVETRAETYKGSRRPTVLGRQIGNSTPWLTERHGYDPTYPKI